MTKRIKTTKKDIAVYWQKNIDDGLTSITFDKATTHCWRCGVKKRLDRCHIIPHSKAGEDCPSNFILLCKHCHFDNPNLDNVSIIWDWLKAYRVQSKLGFWFDQGEREYEFIYHKNIDDELKALGYQDRNVFIEYFIKNMNEAGHHFGQPRRNRATVAGTIYLTLKMLEDMKNGF